MTWLALALAGGLGAACRFGQDTWVGRRSHLSTPVGTVSVNVCACLAMGLLTGWATTVAAPHAVTTVVGTGFLGGYSTFSTASVEGARLVLAHRRPAAAVHALGMAAAGLLAAWVGLAVGSLL